MADARPDTELGTERSEERCASCGELIDPYYLVRDDDGVAWCEDCWAP